MEGGSYLALGRVYLVPGAEPQLQFQPPWRRADFLLVPVVNSWTTLIYILDNLVDEEVLNTAEGTGPAGKPDDWGLAYNAEPHKEVQGQIEAAGHNSRITGLGLTNKSKEVRSVKMEPDWMGQLSRPNKPAPMEKGFKWPGKISNIVKGQSLTEGDLSNIVQED
ncbi:hypothetical protein BY996DRAFT_6612760 [Phakopsora pachyrhizi]|nr:hypothetical protein BY996DRAFT_6612760 [Phakopsora pachyrhizi]